jgi:hypothetical protein
VSVLAKRVAMVRAVAEKRLYATVARAARRADGSLPEDLVALLAVPEGRRVSELERLRRPPTRTTGASMAKALERGRSRRTPAGDAGPGRAGVEGADPGAHPGAAPHRAADLWTRRGG